MVAAVTVDENSEPDADTSGTIDLIEVERELCRIPEISAARIVADGAGRPTEVHILATTDKHAKQLVRDVQSVAIATFGLELDRRVISVVQLDNGGLALAGLDAAGNEGTPDLQTNGSGHEVADPNRILVDRVAAEREGIQCHVEVSLRRNDERSQATVTGSAATAAVLRSVAQATLIAMRDLEPAASKADLETASIVRLGERSLAVTSIVILVPPYEEVVSGSAVVRSAGDYDAMARAVLDATNRRLAQLR
jgi:hypothetical protein